MNFKEVTAEDLFGKGVTGLPDTPGLSTTDMQAKFDELVKDVMVPKFNALVRELAVLSGVESVTKELENTETSIPTGSAVAKYIEENGSGNATVEEMTWAEYEALSEAEKMDGTLRVITDRKAGVRFGNVDISGIGDGTVTGAISAINGNLSAENKAITFINCTNNGGTEIVKKNGRVCLAFSAVTSGQLTAGSWVDLGTIPSGFFPKKIKYIAGVNADGNAFLQFSISVSGNISAKPVSTVSSGSIICFQITYDV